jgi:hypothetical protein
MASRTVLGAIRPKPRSYTSRGHYPCLLPQVLPPHPPTCRKIYFAENRAKGRERQDESKPTNNVLAQLTLENPHEQS